jgi:hypothetical protein
MFSFLSDIEASYRDVPYHNRRHGAAVGRAVFSMCKQVSKGSMLNIVAVAVVSLTYVVVAFFCVLSCFVANNNIYNFQTASFFLFFNRKMVWINV